MPRGSRRRPLAHALGGNSLLFPGIGPYCQYTGLVCVAHISVGSRIVRHMATPDDLYPVRQQELARERRRLLKVWQDAELVRRMDAVIIASRGGYADRSEFIAEALRDRIEAEEEIRGLSSATDIEAEAAALAVQPTATARHRFGDWLGQRVPTLPATSGPATNFGLHNRDFPTVWSADWLGRLTVANAGPVAWTDFLAEISEQAWEFAARLQSVDLSKGTGAKLAAGFPTNRKKAEAATSRFREHAVGSLTAKGVRGPLFVFGLVGTDEDSTVALTDVGVHLLARLFEAGVGDGPPFSAAAWAAFHDHLQLHAPEELAVWTRVLAAAADEPDRATLIGRCGWWSGGTADTNVMGYIARGREWGLVELGMRDGRYALTALGQQQANNTTKEVPS